MTPKTNDRPIAIVADNPLSRTPCTILSKNIYAYLSRRYGLFSSPRESRQRRNHLCRHRIHREHTQLLLPLPLPRKRRHHRRIFDEFGLTDDGLCAGLAESLVDFFAIDRLAALDCIEKDVCHAVVNRNRLKGGRHSVLLAPNLHDTISAGMFGFR